jgi:hypothetical protein
VDRFVFSKSKMKIQFEIESVFKLSLRDKVYVFAKQMNSNLDWKLTDNSKLGVIQIENWCDIPRAIDKNGNQGLDLFAFVLKNKYDKDKLKEGQIVELIS